MDTGKKRTEIEHFKVRYDVKAAAEAVISRGLPEIFSIMILKARNYSWTMEEEGKRLGRLTVQAMEYAEKCLFEEGHALQTAKLSLKIYDGLECLHGLSSEDRVLLNCAAILHDIGISAGGRAHHKRSMDMIMAAGLPAFTEREKLIVALIARYHRKTLPAVGHPGYSGICGEDKRRVDVLAGILRVADGLDRTHTNAVTDIACEILPGRILIKCSASRPASSEIRWGKTKSDLMQKAFNRIVEIE
jgi:exopolyphosphatase/guanosine-5'-triphosphate,3'-diphosphate pyrophosphatase